MKIREEIHWRKSFLYRDLKVFFTGSFYACRFQKLKMAWMSFLGSVHVKVLIEMLAKSTLGIALDHVLGWSCDNSREKTLKISFVQKKVQFENDFMTTVKSYLLYMSQGIEGIKHFRKCLWNWGNRVFPEIPRKLRLFS